MSEQLRLLIDCIPYFPDCSTCARCGASVENEFYMVHGDVWAAGRFGTEVACVGCLEHRLGRHLVPADFKPLAMNRPHGGMSARLLSRLDAFDAARAQDEQAEESPREQLADADPIGAWLDARPPDEPVAR